MREIPQGHSCSWEEKSSYADSFRGHALAKAHRIQFGGPRLVPRGGGQPGAAKFSDCHLWLSPPPTGASVRFQGIVLPVCKHLKRRPRLPRDHKGSQTLPIFLETLAARPAACCLMQQFATPFWERSLPRGAGRGACAPARAGTRPSGRGRSFSPDVRGAGRAGRPLAARAGDLSLIKLLPRHWLTD